MASLATQELLVFQTAVLQAHLTLGQLARQLGMREHSVRRAFESLREKGAILGKRPYLNPASFGLTEYLIYISLIHGNKALRSAFVKMLCDCERSCLVAEVGGDFQYEVRLLARDSQDLMEVLDSLTSAFKANIKTPALAILHDEEYSAVRFVSGNAPKVPSLKYAPASRKVVIDELDHKILSLLANDDVDSQPEIGRRLGLPTSTVAYRIKHLEKSGVIAGYCYLCDVKPLGYAPLSLLIESSVLTVEKRKIFYDYCRKHDRVALAHTLIGPWQARLHARVQEYQEALIMIHELQEKLPDDIEGIRIMPQLRFLKYALYSFRNYASVIPRNGN